MWSADRDGDVEGDDETTDILNSLEEHCIGILQGIPNHFGTQHGGLRVVLTLTHNITLRRLGAPVETIPIMLNTSVQSNGYNPSKNSFNLPNTR